MTPSSIDDYLHIAEPHLPKALISRRWLAAVRRLSRRLPAGITSLLAFECRLGDEPSDAGFAIAISGGAEAEALAGHPLSASFLQQLHWQRLRDFCATWTEPSSVLHSEVKNVCVEFDVGPGAVADSTPSVFMGLQHGVRRSGAGASSDKPRPVQKALHALTGRWVPGSVAQMLYDCVDRLPPQAEVFQLGCMSARADGPLRICVAGLAPGQIASYLSDIRWAGDVGEVAALVDGLVRFVDRIDLALDVSGQVGPRIGLECPFLPRGTPHFVPQWQAFLGYLVENGLCSDTKRDALISYPGLSHERAEPERWPRPLLDLSAFMGSTRVSTVTRALHHGKISLQDGRPTEAKAYLAVQHQWLPMGGIRASS